MLVAERNLERDGILADDVTNLRMYFNDDYVPRASSSTVYTLCGNSMAANASRGELVRYEPVDQVASPILLYFLYSLKRRSGELGQTCQDGLAVVEAADYICRHKTCCNVWAKDSSDLL